MSTVGPSSLVIEPFGPGVWIAPRVLESDPLARATALARLAQTLRARADGELDVVLGGRSVLALAPAVRDWEALLTAPLSGLGPPAQHEIEVVYDGPDLDAVASRHGLSREAVIALHSGPEYRALLTGFLPGFAYLHRVASELVTPRLPQPRRQVGAGAVAIAGPLSAVYPLPSPGGWNLIGSTDVRHVLDRDRTPMQRIAPLDRVRFVPRSAPLEPEPVPGDEGAWPGAEHAALVVESTRGGCTVQDRGRFGHRHAGVPWSGALDAESLALANRAVGNAAGAAALEVLVGAVTFRAERRCLVSIDGEPPRTLAAGDRVTVDPRPKLVRYLALAGAVEVAPVLGSASTLLSARLGGLRGRALRAGDRVCCGHDRGSSQATQVIPFEVGPALLRVTSARADERLPAHAFEQLLAARSSVSPQIDRMGVRFAGLSLPRQAGDIGLPDPMLPGALQVTADGTVIALGPDAAVTGGYPVVAWLDDTSRAKLGRLRPGHEVRFVAH